jgi:hypothetical protein
MALRATRLFPADVFGPVNCNEFRPLASTFRIGVASHSGTAFATAGVVAPLSGVVPGMFSPNFWCQLWAGVRFGLFVVVRTA